MSPQMPRSACSTPGCPGRAVLRGRCVTHAEQVSRLIEQERGTSTERGYGAAWRKKRNEYLLENPFCVQCWALGREQYAEEVDHIIPKRLGGADDESNEQALCKQHHSMKTMKELNRARRGQG